jgi:hypothetical protein
VSWHDYQEDVAKFFRELGCDAEVDARVQGARASHNIDIWVTFHRFGLKHKWAIECKQYQRPVPKEKVLALKGVVDDIGADRGVLIAESGFQPAAINAAISTNISLLTFAKLRELAKIDLLAGVLRKIEDKAELLSDLLYELFWPEPEPWYSTPRPGVDEEGYFDKAGELSFLKFKLKQARKGKFPIAVGATYEPQEKLIFARNLEELVEWAGSTFEKIEKWVKEQEAAIRKLQ